MKVLTRVLVLLVHLLLLGSVLFLFLAISESMWGLLLVAGGFALMASLSAGQTRAYRRMIGPRLRLHSKAISLPDAGFCCRGKEWCASSSAVTHRSGAAGGMWSSCHAAICPSFSTASGVSKKACRLPSCLWPEPAQGLSWAC